MRKIITSILIIVFGMIFIHAPLSVIFGNIWPEFSDFFKAWKEILLAVCLVLLIIEVFRRGVWREIFNNNILLLLAGYVLIHLIMVVVNFQGLLATLAGILIDIRLALAFFASFIVVRLWPEISKKMTTIIFSGLIFVVGFGFLQTFLPHDNLAILGYDKNTNIAPYQTIDQNYDFVRINSTMRGPNPLGAMMVIFFGLLAAFLVAELKGKSFTKRSFNVKSMKFWLIFGAIGLAGVWVLVNTFSRSAWVASAVCLMLTFLIIFGKKIGIKCYLAIGFWLIFSGFLMFIYRDSAFISNILLHRNPESTSAVGSNDDHLTSLETGIERLIDQPLGAGVGSTGSASLFGQDPIIIENQYLFIAHEIGWLGLLWFIVLFAVVLFSLYRIRDNFLAVGVLASGIALGLIGFLLPVWNDDVVAIIWWGMAGICLGQSRNVRQKLAKNKLKGL